MATSPDWVLITVNHEVKQARVAGLQRRIDPGGRRLSHPLYLKLYTGLPDRLDYQGVGQPGNHLLPAQSAHQFQRHTAS